MTFRISHEFLMIGKESMGFSKNYFYEWDDGLGGHATQLFLNLQIDSTQVPGSEVGDTIFEVMKNYFFHDLERDAGDRFEDMLKEVNNAVTKKEEELGVKFIPNVSVIIAVIADDALFLSQHGHAEAYLIRKRFVSTLSEGLSDPKNKSELFANIANGNLVSGDYILFSSTRLLRYVAKSDLGRLTSDEGSLHRALEAINDAVSVDLMDRMNILGIHVGEQEVTTIEEGEETGAPELKSSKLAGFGASLKLSLGKLIPRKSKDVQAQSDEIHTRASHVLSEMEEMEVTGKGEKRERHTAIELQESEETEVEMGVPAEVPSKKSKSDFAQLMTEWRAMKRDKILIALVVVVVILIVGIFVVRHQGQKQQILEEMESKLEQVEINISEAKTVGSYDKDKGKILLDEAEEYALEVLNSGYLRGKASELLTEIEKQRDFLDNVTRIVQPTVAIDFSTIDPTAELLGMVSLGDEVFVYTHNQLYEVLLDEVQAPVTIDPNEVVVDAVTFDENDSILFLTKSNRILEYKDEQFTFLDTDDGSWHSADDIAVYNSRIYLLDSAQNEIWRYYPQRGTYSGADSYVTDEDFDLTQAISFAVDGSVFILQDDGELDKLEKGEDFELIINKAPATDISGGTQLYTEFEMFQVFVLDPSSSRVMIYLKDSRTGNLNYSKQYIFDNVEELNSMYVNKDDSKLYLVGQTQVYELPY